MTRNDRMDGCVCANGAKVVEIVHPYCPAHVPPEMEAQLASLRAELAEAAAHVRELERNALPSNCTRCNGAGAEPPGCPESGPCERRGGWTTHKRLVAGEASTLRAEVERLKAELKQARKDRDREALDRQTAGDAWNDMRRQRDTALADLARVTPSAEVRAAWSRVSRYVGHSGAHEDACDAADIVNDWLASLPGSDKEPEGFCACGRRASECDRSRKACTSSVAP